MALTRDQIVQVALELMNEFGLEEVSTRRIAAVLGVKGPALYKHFRSKADLLDAMAAAMLSERFSTIDQGLSWDDWLLRLSQNARAAALTYRDGSRLLIASSPSAAPRIVLAQELSQPLLRQGFDQEAARLSLAIVASFVTGWALNEQHGAAREVMAFGRDSVDEAFDEAVRTILTGIAHRRGDGEDTPAAPADVVAS